MGRQKCFPLALAMGSAESPMEEPTGRRGILGHKMLIWIDSMDLTPLLLPSVDPKKRPAFNIFEGNIEQRSDGIDQDRVGTKP